MFKKVLTYSVVITTMIWSVGILAIPITVGAATSGDLIKLQCATNPGMNDPCKRVYYLGSDLKRYVFTHEKSYMTWYSDFSNVKIVSLTEMSSYPLSGSNVTYRPGVKMLKIDTDPKVYAVDANGTLRWVKTAEVAAALYGANWARTSVDDLSDGFFADYKVGADINVAADFNKATATANSPTINDDKNLGGTTPGAGTGSSLTVALAADTPAAGIVVGGAARVPFTKVNLTASNDGDIVIDTWVVQRAGLGSDGSFSSIDIVDAATGFAINESGKTFSSEHTANFTEDFTIPAGTTRSVYLSGNMVSLATMASYAGEVPALALKAITLKGTGAVIGTLPITGNYQTTNATITIGTATVQRGAYSNATSTALEVGKLGYSFFSFQVQAGSTEDISFSQVKVYQSGSASLASDLANVKLYEDGTLLATGIVSGNYVTFSFTAITLPKGQTKQYQVKADVVSGSARTIKLAIYRTTDLLVKGLTYGYNITPTYSSTGSAATNPVLTDNQATISNGTLRVGRSNTVAAGNITVGSDQTVGAFEFEAKGEPVIISALTLTIATSSGAADTCEMRDAFKNVRIVNSAGSTVAGPTDPTHNVKTVAFSDTFTVPVGLHVYKVVGTIATNCGWATNDTIYAGIQTPASAITAKGETTGNTITADPSSNINASTQTVKAANVTVTKNSTPTNKNVIVNSTGVLLGSWSLDASNSGEDIRITTIAIRASTTGKINNLTLKDGSTALSPINNAPTVSANTSSTFALSSPLIITKGTSKTLNLYGDIGSDAVAGQVDAWGCNGGCLTAYGVTTGNSATVTATNSDGALLTVVDAGSLTVNLDSSSLASRQVVAGSTGQSLTDVRIKATNEDVDITKINVAVADGALTGTAAGDYTQISKFYVKLDGTTIGDASGYSIGATNKDINFERGQLTIPDGSTGRKLSIVADIVQIGTNLPGASNADIKVGLGRIGEGGFTAYGNGSNASAAVTAGFTSTGSAVIIHKAVPQVVIVTPSNKLGATAVIHRTNITAVGGPVGIYRLSYQISSSTSVIVSNYYTKLASCAGGCGGISDGSQLAAADAAGSYLNNGYDVVDQTVSSSQSHGKYYLGIGTGATAVVDLYASVTLTTNSDTVSTSLLGDTPSTTVAANDGKCDTTTLACKADGYDILKQGNFIWSDLAVDDSNSATATTGTKQWFNGYYVSGLGSTTTSTPVTIGE